MPSPMPLWLVYDPETPFVWLDIQAAAAEGAGVLTVTYEEEANNHRC